MTNKTTAKPSAESTARSANDSASPPPPAEDQARPGLFQRFLNWLIRGAERSRRDRGRCPT